VDVSGLEAFRSSGSSCAKRESGWLTGLHGECSTCRASTKGSEEKERFMARVIEVKLHSRWRRRHGELQHCMETTAVAWRHEITCPTSLRPIASNHFLKVSQSSLDSQIQYVKPNRRSCTVEDKHSEQMNTMIDFLLLVSGGDIEKGFSM